MLVFLFILACISGSKENASFGEEAVSCQNGLVLENGHCCWKGQAWNGDSCVGEPICPDSFQVTGVDCACREGKTPVKAGEVGSYCCWEGQGYSSYERECVGEPICPAPGKAVGNDCEFSISGK